jgi:AP-2 complex subunit mu-1
VLIYELLDEIMDYGYPQITDINILKKYITQEGYKYQDQEKLKEILTTMTGAVSWRPPNVFHPTNEIYLDVIESVNLLINRTGEIIKAEVNGAVTLKSLLSGDPICKFGMNDKLQISQGNTNTKGISIEDLRFHQCVRLSDFNKDRTITFIPPDGVFDLMTFRVTENVIIPFKIYCNIIETPSIDNPSIPQNIDLDLNVKALFDKLLFAQDIIIKVQIPKNATNVKTHTNMGKAKHEPEKGAIVWRIKKVNGDKECKLKCEVPLISVKDPKPWTRSPISMEFNIPMFTASGLRVRFLKVQEKSGYKPLKWIRYVTKAGDFQFRI